MTECISLNVQFDVISLVAKQIKLIEKTMASDDELSVLAKLSLRVAQLESELEILKYRQGITDLRIDGLVLGSSPLTTSSAQQEEALPASAEPSAQLEQEVPLTPPKPSSPICVVWPLERQRQQEIHRRRVAFEEARDQRSQQAQAQAQARPQPQVQVRPHPQFASEPGVADRPPTPFPRRFRRQGGMFL